MSAHPEPVREEPGRALVRLCEEVLGVQGPSQLARATSRSKSWWSKLERGAGATFPDWAALREVVTPALDPPLLAEMQRRHRLLWLRAYDSDVHAGDVAPATRPPVQLLLEVRELALDARACGRYERALRGLLVVEQLLQVGAPEDLSEAERVLLSACYSDRSACYTLLGRHDEAIRAAERGVRLGRTLRQDSRSAATLHQLGLALAGARFYPESVKVLRAAARRYQLAGDAGEVIRAHRDVACGLARLGRHTVARRLLQLLIEQAANLEPKHQFLNLVALSELHALAGRLRQARACFEEALFFADQHADGLAEYLTLVHVQQRLGLVRREIEQRELRPPATRGS